MDELCCQRDWVSHPRRTRPPFAVPEMFGGEEVAVMATRKKAILSIVQCYKWKVP